MSCELFLTPRCFSRHGSWRHNFGQHGLTSRFLTSPFLTSRFPTSQLKTSQFLTSSLLTSDLSTSWCYWSRSLMSRCLTSRFLTSRCFWRRSPCCPSISLDFNSCARRARIWYQLDIFLRRQGKPQLVPWQTRITLKGGELFFKYMRRLILRTRK